LPGAEAVRRTLTETAGARPTPRRLLDKANAHGCSTIVIDGAGKLLT